MSAARRTFMAPPMVMLEGQANVAIDLESSFFPVLLTHNYIEFNLNLYKFKYGVRKIWLRTEFS